MKKILLTLLTVVCAVSSWADTETLTLATDAGIKEITVNKNGTNTSGGDMSISKGDITVTSSTGYFAGSGTNGIQIYKNGKMIVSVPATKQITKIVLTLAGSCYPFTETPDESLTLTSKGQTDGQQNATYTISPATQSVTFSNASTGQTKVKKIVVTYEASGAALVNVTGVSLNQTSATMMVGDKINLTATVAPADATNKSVSWESSDASIATVSDGVVFAKKAGNTTITVKTADGNKTATCDVTVNAKVAPVGSVFFESFDAFDGAGGNDGTWGSITTSPALGTFDNTGWTTEGNVLSGSQCVSIRKSTADTGGTDIPSGLTTPAIGVAGNGHVTFNAQSWTGDTQDFYVNVIGGGTFETADGVNLTNNNTTAKVSLSKNASWDNFDLSFTGLTANSKFRFYMAKGKRGFLDEVAVFVTPATSDNITIGETGYSTYFNSTTAYTMPDDCEGYVFTAENGLELAYEAEDVVPAGEPLVIYTIEPGTKTLNFTTSTEETYKSGDMNDLEGTDVKTALTPDNDSYFYGLSLNSSNDINSVGFYWMNATGAAFTNGAHKAYLKLPKTPGAKSAFRFNNTTGIKTISNEQSVSKAVKRIMNGQLIIEKAGKMYNAAGAEVK